MTPVATKPRRKSPKRQRSVRPNTTEILPFDQYEKIIVSFSGGKDSLAMLLHLLELGVPKGKIELWHQRVDGTDEDGLMDWPCTDSYCKAVAKALDLKILFQWREGGIEREMMRNDSPTAPVSFEALDGEVVTCPSVGTPKLGTRLMFPQPAADLSVRWCSAYVKIDVASRAINNDPRFGGTTVLYVSGERRQESESRALYAEAEKHRCSNLSRRVDHWRPIIDLSEEQVWDIISRWKIQPHPAYRLGFGRVSCMTCIFADDDQWASIQELSEVRINRIARLEDRFGKTISFTTKQVDGKKKVVQLPVLERARRGRSFVSQAPAWLVRLAMGRDYPVDQVFTDDWEMPAGAFKHCGGPT
jgi:3'-phosphoadenosine 5'-phosphosulfate sulfotransferase (PAPS reductase)/FAD synthetase